MQTRRQRQRARVSTAEPLPSLPTHRATRSLHGARTSLKRGTFTTHSPTTPTSRPAAGVGLETASLLGVVPTPVTRDREAVVTIRSFGQRSNRVFSSLHNLRRCCWLPTDSPDPPLAWDSCDECDNTRDACSNAHQRGVF